MNQRTTSSSRLRALLAGSATCLALMLPASLEAAVLNLSIQGLSTPTAGSSDPVVAFALAAEGANPGTITHLVTGPLVPLSDEAPNRLGSYYSGVNSANGDVQEVGIVAVEATGYSPSVATATAPIGVFARSGSWASQAKTPLDSTVAGTRAAASYSTSDIAIVGGDTVAYEVIDENTVALDGFELSVGGKTVSFGAANLTRYGNYYRGLLPGLEAAGLGDAALLVTLEVPDDTDGDQIPNLSDASSSGTPWYEPYTLAADGMVSSNVFQQFWFANGAPDYIYHKGHGWWYLQPSATNLFVYDFVLGWLWTAPSIYPAVYAYNTGEWLSFSVSDEGGTRWFWNYSSNPQDWTGVAFSL